MSDDTLKPDDIAKGVEAVLGGLLGKAEAARKADPGYADLFAHDDVLYAVDEARRQMRRVASNLLAVLRDKHGLPTDRGRMRIAYGLPLVGLLIREQVEQAEGRSCCEDKTRVLLARMFRDGGPVEGSVTP